MPTHAQHVPVLIIGAGPSGIAMATLLAQRGVETMVVERHRGIYPLPRAVHLDDEVHRILQTMGVADEFAAISKEALGMRLVDAELTTMLELRRAGVGEHGWPQANMFDQPVLEALLRRNLEGFSSSTLVSGMEATVLRRIPDGDRSTVEVELVEQDSSDRHIVTADFVIGCDGANSATREFLDTKMVDLHFEEPWLVVDVRCGEPLDVWDGVYQVCDPSRPSTFMQIGPDRYRWEFRVNPGENVDELASENSLRALLAPWFADTSWGAVEVLRHAGYTFRAAVADVWGRNGVFILGDAAHLMPPFIGQGMGAGFRDAANLAWKLAAVLGGTAEMSILDSYQEERKPHVTQIIRAAVALGWVMAGGKGFIADARQSILARVCRLPGFSGTAMKSISPRIRAGLLARRRVLVRNPVGLLLPQPCPGDDDRLGSGFSLVHRGFVDRRLGDLASTLGAETVVIGDDPSGRELASWMDRHRAKAVLVRPDRVVADFTGLGNGRERDCGWARSLVGSRVGMGYLDSTIEN